MASHQITGIQGQVAPPWGIDTWFNLPDGQSTFSLGDVEDRVVYMYCFQSWCPGCHSHGFPTLLAVRDAFDRDEDVEFVAIQTVFEGFEANTLEGAKEVARRYQLEIPFGHDPGPDGRRSIVMRRYRTGGTPWTVIIDQQGYVRFNGFQAQAEDLTDGIRQIKTESLHRGR
jgi:thiol-disulfide isomerase/thioredoxin